jgi:signal peptidase I
MKKQRKKRGVLRAILFVFISLFLGLGVYGCNAQNLTGNLMPMPFGMGVGVVMSGSMEPKMSVDDFIVVVKRQTYSEGELVVYQERRLLVVHEIIRIEEGMVTTKGAANNSEDEPIPMSAIKGEVVLQIKGVGKFVRWMKSPFGTLLILTIAFLLLVKSYNAESKQSDETNELNEIKQEIERLKAAEGERQNKE